MKKYADSSMWAKTPRTDFHLDILQYREIPPHVDDVLVTLKPVYQHRPDLLASDVYDNPSLWWIFSVRNPNAINDPIWDFVPNLRIYVPTKKHIRELLNL